MNFWDFKVWGLVNLVAVLLLSLLVANVLKRKIKWLKNSLIPTSVLGGLILLVINAVYEAITGTIMFNTPFFAEEAEGSLSGMDALEIITYHTLALGFIASTLKTGKGKLTKKRSVEVFNTGSQPFRRIYCKALWGLGLRFLRRFSLRTFLQAREYCFLLAMDKVRDRHLISVACTKRNTALSAVRALVSPLRRWAF